MKPTCLLAALLFATAPAFAQEVPPPPPPGQQAPAPGIRIDGKAIRLPEGSIEIDDLITSCARFLGRNMLFNPAELMAGTPNTQFVLQKPIVLDAAGCEELLYSLLYTKGFAVIPIDADKGVYEVVSMMGPRGREVANHAVKRTAAEVLARPAFKEYVVVSVPLVNINAQVATAALRPFFASAGAPGNSLCIGNVGNNTSILMMGFTDQVASALRLLAECDKAAPAEQPPTGLQQRLEALEAMVAQLQKQVEALQKGK